MLATGPRVAWQSRMTPTPVVAPPKPTPEPSRDPDDVNPGDPGPKLPKPPAEPPPEEARSKRRWRFTLR